MIFDNVFIFEWPGTSGLRVRTSGYPGGFLQVGTGEPVFRRPERVSGGLSDWPE